MDLTNSLLVQGGTIINGPGRVASSSTDGFSEVERNASDEKFSHPNLSFSLETELCVQ